MKKITVIVVDDNLVSRLLPRFILSPFSAFVKVLECESGVDALSLITLHQVTHALLDISMPGMDGVNLAKKIRSFSMHSQIRLVAYTANAQDIKVAYLKSVGFDDVLLKPMKSAELLQILNILESK